MITAENQHRIWGLVLVLLVAAIGGCNWSSEPEVQRLGQSMTPEQLQALQSLPLKLLVVGSPDWADEIQVQFQGRVDATLEPTAVSLEQWRQMSDDALSEFDVLIIPPDRIPALAAQGTLLRFHGALGERWDLNSYLSIDRRLGRMDQDMFAVSLGVPLWMMVYNADLLQGQTLPEEWSQWNRLAGQDRGQAGQCQWIEALGEQGAAEALLLRAGSLARSTAQTDVFIGRQEELPRLNSPPFLRALEDMREAYGPGADEAPKLNARQAIDRVIQGQAKAAIVPLVRLDDARDPLPQLKIAPPPGSRRYFNFFDQTWLAREGGQLLSGQLIGTRGRVACVLRRTRKSEAAFRLIDLLIQEPTALNLADLNPDVAPFRQPHLEDLPQWVGRQYSREAIQMIEQIYRHANDDVQGGAARMPPLPGHDDRLAALDQAVWQVLEQGREPAEALAECQERWVEIARRTDGAIQRAVLSERR